MQFKTEKRSEERTYQDGDVMVSIEIINGQFKNGFVMKGRETLLNVDKLDHLDIVLTAIKFIKDQLEEKEIK